LTIQAEVTTDELGVLADSFNYMTEELSNLVVRVKTLSQEVESATITSFDRMAQLVQGADLQIQQIVTAAVEVGDMAASSRNVAERSQVLTEIATTARQTAQGGRGAVQQTVAGIRRIERNVKSTAEKVQVLGERSREINDIVKVISSIAHQTNRLALDAAIQAAMAGENGKGFGAVASDIRRLAERSKEQTLMIGQIVYSVLDDISGAASAMSDTERETTSGTHLIEEAGLALESIFSVVEQQASEISTINQVAMKQLQSSNAVVQIMQSVSDSTQQSNTSTREVSMQMEHVAQLAEQLLTSVDVFKVREGRTPQLAGAARSDIRALPASNQDPYNRSSYNTPMQIPERFSQPLQRDPSQSGDQFSFYPPNTPYPVPAFQQPSPPRPVPAFQQPSTPRPNQDEYQQQYNGNGQQYNNGNGNGNGQQYNNGNGNGNGQQYNNGNNNGNGQQYNNGNNNSQQYNNGRNRP
jgi:methyl-accepting chemotaxis protein